MLKVYCMASALLQECIYKLAPWLFSVCFTVLNGRRQDYD